MQITDSVFIVTGGASGLGAATAEGLIAAGAKVMLADMNVDAGVAMAAKLGPNARFHRTNVADAAEGQSAVEAALDHFGGLNGLVNCAGIAPGEKTLGKDGPHRLESFSKAVTVNLIGSFNMARLAAEAMAKNTPNAGGERGVIVNTASIAAYDGQIGQVAYAASKGGVVGMTLPMARDLSRLGIRVMTIAPGIFLTPMLMGLPEEVRQQLAMDVTCPKRLGDPAEYASLARFIVESGYLNGETIRIDGALRMR